MIYRIPLNGERQEDRDKQRNKMILWIGATMIVAAKAVYESIRFGEKDTSTAYNQACEDMGILDKLYNHSFETYKDWNTKN